MSAKRKYLPLVLALIILGLIGAFLGFSINTPRTISGEVSCPKGEDVVGVWVDAARQEHDGWARWRPVAGQRYQATFEHRVPGWPFPYSINVGCGGTKGNWESDNASGMLFTGFHALECKTAEPTDYYGKCR